MTSSAAPDSQATLDEVLARSIDGDEHAWRCLIERYSRRVYALARSRLRQDELAEEITQSVFVTIAARLGDGGYSERGRFESWLFRVAMNRIRDEVRRRARHADPIDPVTLAERSSPDDSPEYEAESLSRLRTAIDSLNEQDREIIELRHHAEMTFKRIADHLDQPLGTVLARHHRALAKLRQLLEEPAQSASPKAAKGVSP